LLLASGVLLYLLAVALHYVLVSEASSREAERQAMQARVLARDSELKALKAQVNPHFIFNSLNSISALTSADAPKAREMCVLLGDFLRKTLGLGEKPEIPLSEEMTLIRSYLSVEKIRFGARLDFEEKIAAEALDCMVPPLLLQPLVENAISHGISGLTEGGWIRLEIRLRENQGDLMIRVENNFDPESPRRRGAGMGLKNVRQRLAASYAGRASIDARAETEKFTVTVELPAVRAMATA
jgi:LytS/YehU family sensor histidine kinase